MLFFLMISCINYKERAKEELDVLEERYNFLNQKQHKVITYIDSLSNEVNTLEVVVIDSMINKNINNFEQVKQYHKLFLNIKSIQREGLFILKLSHFKNKLKIFLEEVEYIRKHNVDNYEVLAENINNTSDFEVIKNEMYEMLGIEQNRVKREFKKIIEEIEPFNNQAKELIETDIFISVHENELPELSTSSTWKQLLRKKKNEASKRFEKEYNKIKNSLLELKTALPRYVGTEFEDIITKRIQRLEQCQEAYDDLNKNSLSELNAALSKFIDTPFYELIQERINYLNRPQEYESSKEYYASSETSYEESAKEGCYIATMAYGDYEHPQVLELRKFRDIVLKKYHLGRGFIKFYYTVSPFLVEKLGDNMRINRIIRKQLDGFIEVLKFNGVI